MPLFEVKELDWKIYREELEDFLPQQMIDIHTHVWLSALRRRTKPISRRVTWPSLVARDNSVEDLQETYRLMFPGKKVTPLIFASTERETIEPCNAYVREAAGKTGFPALYYARPEETADELERKIREGGYVGIKSYLDLSPSYIPEAEVRIFDFFPKHQLRRMNELGAVVMLHIPRHGRLKDPVNLAQMIELKQQFPEIRLIIAHIGRAYTREDIGNAFEVLSACPGLMFDFSANSCEYAMTRLLEAVGPRHVLFGSDLPILRMRTKRIEENGTYINLVPPGLYGGSAQDSHLREVSREEGEKMTFFMYEELLAFKRAASSAGLGKKDLEDVFYNNAKALLDGAKKDICR